MKCIVCGKLSKDCVCDECRESVDIKKLCREVAEYIPGKGVNPLWDESAAELKSPYDFKYFVLDITKDVNSPQKELIRMQCLSQIKTERLWLSKASLSWFLKNVWSYIETDELSVVERSFVGGIALNVFFYTYQYDEAEKIASIVSGQDNIAEESYYSLIEYYTKTRRYELASDYIAMAKERYFLTGSTDIFERLLNDNEKRKNGEKNGYEPNPRENRNSVKKKYRYFLQKLGIEADGFQSGGNKTGGRNRIRDSEYPKFDKWVQHAGFKSFVAYDLETAGFHLERNCVLEIGAVKVIDGKLIDKRQYKFQELIYPYGGTSKIEPEAFAVHGISMEKAKAGRDIQEIWKEFVEFIGSDILIGFNNAAFDSPRLRRAGRYGKIAISPTQFDVMKYAAGFAGALGYTVKRGKVSLETVAESLGIHNPRAHRAYADAWTTAKVYLKLLEIDNK